MTYTLGLDIGIASVGWCLLAEDRIIDLGVRAFDKAETAKEGESLNKARRDARLMRHRLSHRAERLKKLARLLKRSGLIDSPRFFHPDNPYTNKDKTLWQLRVEGLDHLLAPEEWARVIYHLVKHRGFHWMSRAEEKAAETDAKGEGGKVKQGLASTARLMEEKNYRSAAEMALAEFPQAQRNKRGEYSKALARVLLGQELKDLFAAQRGFGNTYADTALETAILGNGDRKSGIFWQQKPALSGNALLKMLGKCTFEKGEYRAPKASFTAERHVWLTKLNNLRIVVDGTTRPLNEAERRVALPLPYTKGAERKGLTYGQLRNALVGAGLLPENFKFAGLAYPSERQLTEDKAKKPEDAALVKLAAWHTLRKKLEGNSLATEWQGMAGAAQDGRPEQLDDIARVLSVYKDGDEVVAELRKLALPGGEKLVAALSEVSFNQFSNLSLKALRKIVPFMAQGQRYDEACRSAGYHHSQLLKPNDEKELYLLPAFYENHRGTEPGEIGKMIFSERVDRDIIGGIPRNPVVLRALNQARKVVNAVIRKQKASPVAVHIELARDLSRPLDERKKIADEQKEYRDRNKNLFDKFVEAFGQKPKERELEKWRLYHEQGGKSPYSSRELQGKSPYSQDAIDLNRLLDPGYVEVDHVLPWSRSFDDSKNNKVLVFTKENRDKGNRTPYEYLTSFAGGENGERWRSFVAFVEENKSYRQTKRSRLLKKNFDEKDAEEFRKRNLNDTRYICRFFKNYVERYLQPKGGVVTVNGGLTSLLRARWGLPTSKEKREKSDRHHAMDAAIVAACGRLIVQETSTLLNAGEWTHKPELGGYVNIKTGEVLTTHEFVRRDEIYKLLPRPWKHFREELLLRLEQDDLSELKSGTEHLRPDTYSAEELKTLRPLFVSRAPQRRNSGAAHKDTIYGQPERLRPQGGVTQKVALSALSLKDMDNLIDPHRNERLYAAIRKRLEEHGGKGDKAFPAGTAFRKPDKDGNPTGPIVRTVTMVIDKLSGIPIRGGIAKNDSMLRVDVFTKAGKFHLVPVYVHHRIAGLPNRAIVAFKDEEEWTLIDESFDWCFSLHPNDLVRIKLKKETFFGYYASTDRSTGAISLWAHDRNQAIGKDGLMRSIGVKTAVKLEKFEVDVLGNIYPARPEPRRGLA
ncbi:CRISPR-associated endonuclease Cas9 [Betaproteobacteria bacterium]|nr:CRISPR-associated endonuclease Cas9 [Betaproteobacteria bacterium]